MRLANKTGFGFGLGYVFNGGSSSSVQPAQILLSVLATNGDPDTHSVTGRSAGSSSVTLTTDSTISYNQTYAKATNTLLGSHKTEQVIPSVNPYFYELRMYSGSSLKLRVRMFNGKFYAFDSAGTQIPGFYYTIVDDDKIAVERITSTGSNDVYNFYVNDVLVKNYTDPAESGQIHLEYWAYTNTNSVLQDIKLYDENSSQIDLTFDTISQMTADYVAGSSFGKTGDTLLVNDGGASEITWSLPFPMLKKKGWYPVVNHVDAVANTFDKWSKSTGGTGTITDNPDGSVHLVNDTDAANTASVSHDFNLPVGEYYFTFTVANVVEAATTDSAIMIYNSPSNGAVVTNDTPGLFVRIDNATQTAVYEYRFSVTSAGTVKLVIGGTASSTTNMQDLVLDKPMLENVTQFINKKQPNQWIPAGTYQWLDTEPPAVTYDNTGGANQKVVFGVQGALIPESQRDMTVVDEWTIAYNTALPSAGEFIAEFIAPEDYDKFNQPGYGALGQFLLYQKDGSDNKVNVLMWHGKGAEGEQRKWFNDASLDAPIWLKDDVIQVKVSWDSNSRQQQIKNLTNGVEITSAETTAPAVTPYGGGVYLSTPLNWIPQNVSLNTPRKIYVGSDAPVYRVGDNQGFKTISDVPWDSLTPGTQVLIDYRATTYKERFAIAGQGTASKPITVKGVPDSNGNLPVIDSDGAVIAPKARSLFSQDMTTKAAIAVTSLNDNDLSDRSSNVIIDSLKVVNCHPDNTYIDDNSNVVNYADFGANIWGEATKGLRIQNCEIEGGSNGIFTGHKAGTTEDLYVEDLVIFRNKFLNNGVSGSNSLHDIYASALKSYYIFNEFLGQAQGAGGVQIKDRSAGCIIAYNRLHSLNSSKGWDMVEPFNTPALLAHDLYGVDIVKNNLIYLDAYSDNMHHGGDYAQKSIFFELPKYLTGVTSEYDYYRKGKHNRITDNTHIIDITDPTSVYTLFLHYSGVKSNTLIENHKIFISGEVNSSNPPSPFVQFHSNDTGYKRDHGEAIIGTGNTITRTATKASTVNIDNIKSEGFTETAAADPDENALNPLNQPDSVGEALVGTLDGMTNVADESFPDPVISTLQATTKVSGDTIATASNALAVPDVSPPTTVIDVNVTNETVYEWTFTPFNKVMFEMTWASLTAIEVSIDGVVKNTTLNSNPSVDWWVDSAGTKVSVKFPAGYVGKLSFYPVS